MKVDDGKRRQMIRKIVGLHFSPNGGTARITEQIVRELAADLSEGNNEEIECDCYDLYRQSGTRPEFGEDTVAVIGMPVRIGKLPLPALRAMQELHGSGAMTVAVVSYGSRTYGNAMYELYNYSEDQGFKVIGTGAFIAGHRDETDIPNRKEIGEFCDAAAAKLKRLCGSEIEGLKVKPAPMDICGNMPVHRISKISPKAAKLAEELCEKLCRSHREPEWFL